MATPTGLYNPDGTFRAFSRSSGGDLSIELATRRNAGLLSSGMWSTFLDQLPDPDPVLRKRGDDAAILTELSADDQVTTAMLARKNRVLNCPHYAFRPGAPDGETPTPEAETLYRRLMSDLERTNLRTVISGILDAPFYGFTPLELVWNMVDGWWHLADIVPRPFYWFCFDNDNTPLFRGESWLAINAGLTAPIPLPPHKFVLVAHHATYDNPYGLRLLSRCLWPVTFKRGGLQFYARFVEKYGQPWVVGKAPAKATSDEKRAMAADLARMIQDCVAAIPFGSEVQLLSAGTTQADIHEGFLARQDKAISKLLMGQTLTVEMEGENSLAAAETHKGVADDLADADKAMVADAFNEIAWEYAQVNAGKASAVRAPLFAYEEPEDLNSRADLDKKLAEMGVSFTPEHFTDNYNLKEGEFTMTAPAASPVSAPSATPPPAPASFAAPDSAPLLAEQAQRVLDTALAKLLPEALKANAEFVTQVENAVKTAASFDDVQLSLVELLAPRMEPDALESFLARTMTAAAGFGATAISAEAKEDA